MKNKLFALMIALSVLITASPALTSAESVADSDSLLSEAVTDSISSTASAAASTATSDENAAWNAYYKLLNQNSFYRHLKKDNDNSNNLWYSKNCKFMIAYLDDDDVPEMLVSNYSDSFHYSGFGSIYTYKNGALKFVEDVIDFSGIVSKGGFYERTGWYISSSFSTGNGFENYDSISSDRFFTKFIDSDENYNSIVTEYSINNNACSKAAFETELSKVTGGKALTPYKFYKSTQKNRDIFLKNRGTIVKVNGNQYMISPLSPKTATLVQSANKKSVKIPNSVKINGKTRKVNGILASAFTGKKIRTVTIGKNVKSIAKNAFSKSKATKIVIKTKKLAKKSVKGCLKGSKVKSIKVKVGKGNSKYLRRYSVYFSKQNAGRKVKVR